MKRCIIGNQKTNEEGKEAKQRRIDQDAEEIRQLQELNNKSFLKRNKTNSSSKNDVIRIRR
jgi:hypothetical protein